MQLPGYPKPAKKLFNISEKDMKQLEKVRSFLQPTKVLREDELTGEDRILGFRRVDVAKEWARGKHH